MMPIASIRACIVVGPTKRKPRFFSALLSATDSGVVLDLWSASFEVPEPLEAVAAATGLDPMQLVLGGGEDHCLLATFPDAGAVPDGWALVGEVLEAGDDGPGVTVDGTAYEGPAGWTHF